jgi:tetratricopeptide (TPR) repeat protein/transcriptional regulator with XRE-family HTH domain
VAGQAGLGFGGLLRQLRTEAGLTQEELAGAADVSQRAVSDLERGINRTARKDTALLLAGALGLDGAAREMFVVAARGREPAEAVLAARQRMPGAFAAAATRALPRDTAAFTGRDAELDQLAGALDGLSANGGVVGIHAIDGMAGIGKTTFAVHAAHRLAGSFPDGQFFLALHAHTAGQRPVHPADGLASLLLTAGVPGGQIPPGLEARAARWRDHVAGKKILLLLDDAAGHEQVRPLLPGTPGSLVLVTSRRRLAALDDATAVSLDTLPPGEAAALLVRLAGRAGLSPDDPAVAEITRLCGYLPLAIGMVARQLRHHPAWSAAGRAAELASARDLLDLMATENLSVAAAFNLSYADLTEDQQRLFRRLGLHPGTDLPAARRGLEALYDQHLLTEPAPGRYRLHDLIREHARALAGRLDPDQDRHQATTRLLDYYQHTAARADALIARQTRPAPAPADGANPAAVPALASPERALAWARAEHASLLACLDHATGTGQHARVIALTAGLAGLWENDGAWADAITRHTAAIQAARHLGDPRAEANALNDLGVMRRSTGDYPAAAQAQEQALGIYRDLGDRLGQATALSERGLVRRMTGDYPAAAQAQEQALGIYRDLGDRLGQANALNRLGVVRQMTGDYPAAAQTFEQTLGIYRDLGELLGQAHTLAHLGELRRMTGDYPGAVRGLEQALDILRHLGDRAGEATALNERGTLHRISSELAQAGGCHQQALDLARAIGSSWDEAHALAGLGRCALAAGHAPQAEVLLVQALEIFQQVGAAEGPGLLAELDVLTSAPPGPPRTTFA